MSAKSIIASLKERGRDPDDPDFHDAGPPAAPFEAPAAHAPGLEKADAGDRVQLLSYLPDDRVHTSIYLPRDLRRRLREIAAAEECKVHDLLIEGVHTVIIRRRPAQKPPEQPEVQKPVSKPRQPQTRERLPPGQAVGVFINTRKKK